MPTFEAMATVVLVILLLLSGDATTDESFKQLDVKEEIAAVRITQSRMANPHKVTELDEKQNETSWRLHLLHRDHLPSSNVSSYRYRLHDRLRRDRKRVAALYRGVTHSSTRQLGHYQVQDFGTDVMSGMEEGSGEYFVRVGVGSPPRYQYMVIDSGSDIVWVQCQPCAQCYRQSDPVFNPAESDSFAGVTCGSTVCSQLENSGSCHAGHCRYEVSYGDGSYTEGSMALEILTFGGTMIHNVAMGCGHRNQGLFVGAAGLLGLGGGSLSFVGQVTGSTGGAFGYCLVTRGTGSYGSLVFGRGAIPVGAAWVPLIRNLHAPSFYYIGLKGVGVGGQIVPIPEEVFQLTDSGDGGVVIDTGTAVTRLTEPAYYALRDAFVMATINDLPWSLGVSIFDTCYDLLGFVSVMVPTVSFYFSGGPVLILPARNFMIPVNEMGTFCFAFAPSRSRLSIIGNIQQEGIQISFDAANGFVGFGPNTC